MQLALSIRWDWVQDSHAYQYRQMLKYLLRRLSISIWRTSILLHTLNHRQYSSIHNAYNCQAVLPRE